MSAAYDHANIFARILRGELPCHKVYEDEHVLAFLDIMPRTDGHTLVIPKSPARNLLDIAPEAAATLMFGVRHVAIGLKKALGADGVTMLQSSEPAAQQVVFHMHVHVMPRWDGVKLAPHTSEMAPKEKLIAMAERIRPFLA